MATNDWDDFLLYYKNELSYLRTMGSNFAEMYPKVANRLELNQGASSDPQVERLIESFAFLAARIQYNINGEFPEITTALLGLLYPQFTNPIPSMSIAQFKVDPEQGKLTDGYLVEKNTSLFCETSQGTPCWFRTNYPVMLWPLEVSYTAFERPTQFDFLDNLPKVTKVLRLKLICHNETFDNLSLKKLRFYINGDGLLTNALYELLFNQVFGIAILPELSARPIFLPKNSLLPVGFNLDEDVLPYPSNAHPGYRLLQEYFTFPEKFFFFDIDNLVLKDSVSQLDILILLEQMPNESLTVDNKTFCLGCTPIINLFNKTSEPVRLDHRKLEYRLVADTRRERTSEIHSILKVSSFSNINDNTDVYEPFYSYNHNMERRGQKAFWHARRLPTGRKDLPGTNIYLSFLDLDFKPTLPPKQTIFAHLLCTNRDLAEQMSVGSKLQIEEGAPLAYISCLTKPSTQLSPPLRGTTLWRLISHLSLNYLSLSDNKEALLALREILRLYSFTEQNSLEQEVSGIREMSTRKVVRHIGNDVWRGFCRGIEVTLTFDEQFYVGSGAFLLSAVLSRFFALYSSVNSFTQLVIKSKQKEGIWKIWPPMAGEKIIL